MKKTIYIRPSMQISYYELEMTLMVTSRVEFGGDNDGDAPAVAETPSYRTHLWDD